MNDLSQDAIAALTKVRDALQMESSAFSMQSVQWYSHVIPAEDSSQGECGTAACIYGWVSQLRCAYDLPDWLTRPEYTFDSLYFPEGVIDKDEARRHFGSDAEWFTKKRAVAMLDNLIKTGVVNWLALEEVAA